MSEDRYVLHVAAPRHTEHRVSTETAERTASMFGSLPEKINFKSRKVTVSRSMVVDACGCWGMNLCCPTVQSDDSLN